MTPNNALTTIETTGTSSAVRWLALTTALLSAVTGGSFFAFSTFVMPGLRRLPAGDAIAAMQAINVQAPRSLLMLPLFGSAVGGIALGVLVLVRSDTPHRVLLVGGAAAAVATLAITAIYHVPQNDALAKLNPGTAADWADYYGGWVAWNHVRTLTGLASAVALVAGVLRRG